MRALVTALVALALLAGCSKPGDRLVGTWTGKFEIDEQRAKAAIASDRAAREEASALYNEYGALQVELDVFAHGEYQMLLGPLRTKGTWAFQNGTVRLAPAPQSDSDMVPLEGQVAEDWATLKFSDPSRRDLTELVLARQ